MSNTQAIPRDDFDRLFGHLETGVKSNIENHITSLGITIIDVDAAKQARRLEILMEDYDAEDSELELTEYLIERGVVIPDEAMTRQKRAGTSANNDDDQESEA